MVYNSLYNLRLLAPKPVAVNRSLLEMVTLDMIIDIYEQ